MNKIEVRNLSKSFRTSSDRNSQHIQALADVSLDIQKDEFVSIIGPSGCGKTTLLRIIDGLIQADAGQVLIDGKPVTEPGYDRAVVFQHFGLLPWKTVIENVAFGLKLKGIPRKERLEMAHEYLTLVGLSGFENYYPRQISGGMQQRVGMSRALAIDSDILLMDEPLGAVDAQTREVMQGEILRIWSQRKKTVVFITHSIDEAIYLSDRVVVMDPRPGRVAEILEVDLPRPRWEYEVRADPRFIELRTHAWNHLRSHIQASTTVAA